MVTGCANDVFLSLKEKEEKYIMWQSSMSSPTYAVAVCLRSQRTPVSCMARKKN